MAEVIAATAPSQRVVLASNCSFIELELSRMMPNRGFLKVQLPSFWQGTGAASTVGGSEPPTKARPTLVCRLLKTQLVALGR